MELVRQQHLASHPEIFKTFHPSLPFLSIWHIDKNSLISLHPLYQGQKVEIIADAYPEDVFSGTVKRIAPEAIVEDNVTSFEVRITLLTGQDKLRSKMNVDVTFLGQELKNSLVVPTVAIVTQEGATGVMILNEKNKPEFMPVKIGLTLQDKTQILEGVKADDRVFIDMPDQGRK